MKKVVSIIVLTFLLVSCALESEFSLPNNQLTSRDLLGTWHPKGEKGDLIFKANSDNTFSVTMIDDKGEKTIISPNAYTSIINNYSLLNLVHTSKDGKKSNIFYGYRLSTNNFSFRPVNDKFSDIKISSNEELLNYFEENISKKDFFEDWNEEQFQKK